MKTVFTCDVCLVEFSIEIEPGKNLTDAQMMREFPKSVQWLEEVTSCPVCGDEWIEERR